MILKIVKIYTLKTEQKEHFQSKNRGSTIVKQLADIQNCLKKNGNKDEYSRVNIKSETSDYSRNWI